MFDGQTGSAPCIVSVSGAPFVMAWRFSRGSYFDLAKSFPARLINRYLRAAGALLLLHLVGHPSGGLVLVIGRRMRWEGPRCVGRGLGAAEEAAQPLI